MKLIRYGEKGAEKPAMLAADGRIRDLSGVIDDLGMATVGLEVIANCRTLIQKTCPNLPRGPVWCCCL